MIKRILSMFLVLMFTASICYGDINDWIKGDGTDAVEGADNISDLDTLITNYIQDPLDKLLTESIHGCTLTYATAATVTIGVGEVTCYNAAKTIKRMRRNTSTVTITLPASGASGSSLDTGNAAISTWYHVYAVADADATTFTGICSASASAPTGYTYFRYLGSFYNNAADNIDPFYWYGTGPMALIMWDIPVSLTTSNSSAAWSGALACRMPSTSQLGVFGLGLLDGGGLATGHVIFIRPNGSTWNTTWTNGISGYVNKASIGHSGQRVCATDSSQQIQYQNDNGAGVGIEIAQEGYYITR